MKFCPFCQTENADDLKECIQCERKLLKKKPIPKTPYIGAYNVVITNTYNKKSVIKAMQKELDYTVEEAEEKCEKGLVEDLSKEEAERLARKIRANSEFARAVPAEKVEELEVLDDEEEEILGALSDKEEEALDESGNKVWVISLMPCGENKEKALKFLMNYYGWKRKKMKKIIDKIDDRGKSIIVVDSQQEAEDIVLEMQELGLKVKLTEMGLDLYLENRKLLRRITINLVAMLIVLGVFILTMIGVIIGFSLR